MTHAAKTGGPCRTGAEATVVVVVTTSNDAEGYRIVRYGGIVRVRSASISYDLVGTFNAIGGGDIEDWAPVCAPRRLHAGDGPRVATVRGVLGNGSQTAYDCDPVTWRHSVRTQH